MGKVRQERDFLSDLTISVQQMVRFLGLLQQLTDGGDFKEVADVLQEELHRHVLLGDLLVGLCRKEEIQEEGEKKR